MKVFFKNIKKYFKYAIYSAKAELKSEVSGSYLNWLWWILEPLAFMLIYTYIFTVIFSSKVEYFPVFVFSGLGAWNFFNQMIVCSIKLVSSNRDLVTKVYIPKYILLLSKSFKCLFKLFISTLVTIILMIALGVPFHLTLLNYFLVLPVLYVVSFGVSLILMHFGVFVEDLQNVTNIALRFMFYLSGIFYNIRERLDGLARKLFLRGNPMAFLIDEFRKAILYGKKPSLEGLGFWFLVGCLFIVLGVNLINKYENSYAKVI